MVEVLQARSELKSAFEKTTLNEDRGQQLDDESLCKTWSGVFIKQSRIWPVQKYHSRFCPNLAVYLVSWRRYPVDPRTQETMGIFMQDLEAVGIIESQASPEVTPLTTITKQDGTPHFSIDCTILHIMVFMTARSIPGISACLCRLRR